MAQRNTKEWLIGITLIGAVISMTHVSTANAFEGPAWSRNAEELPIEVYTQQYQDNRAEHFQSYQYSQSQSRNLRSRSDVIQEVKRRHPNAEILRIKLDKKEMVYRVKVYLADGVVTVVRVDARR